MPIERVAIANTPGVYECFPDVCRAANGRLVVIYRESEGHSARQFSHVVARVSEDDGRTWSEPRCLVASVAKDGVLRKWNCPRVQTLADGRLLALCDEYPVPPGEMAGMASVVHFWLSHDNGERWDGPYPMPVRGIVPDKVCVLPSGSWILAAHGRTLPEGRYAQWCYRSEDGGRIWEGPITIIEHATYRCCEASILALPDGELVCYMRENSGRGIACLKSFSGDQGRSWAGPYETLMSACHRPVAGYLRGGDVMVTYRHQPGGKGYWAKNLFAYRETVGSAAERERSQQRGIILPIDHDRSPKSDSGYSGWVNLADGRVFIVNYLLDDSQTAQIRGYWLTEDDF